MDVKSVLVGPKCEDWLSTVKGSVFVMLLIFGPMFWFVIFEANVLVCNLCGQYFGL